MLVQLAIMLMSFQAETSTQASAETGSCFATGLASDEGSVHAYLTEDELVPQRISISAYPPPYLIIERRGLRVQLEFRSVEHQSAVGSVVAVPTESAAFLEAEERVTPAETPPTQSFFVEIYDIEETAPENCLSLVPANYRIGCAMASLGTRAWSECQGDG